MVYSAHVGAPSGAPSVEAVVCCGRKDPQVAAFGHGGVFVEGAFFYKPRPKARDRYENERRFLELICCSCESGEPLRAFVPNFYGEVERDGAWFFKMDDLLHAFSLRGRHIADLKMGLRTFAESEAQSAKPRADLFERMERMEERLGSRVLTDAERASRSMTKARWMALRDSLSSTSALGFRIDALLTPRAHLTAFDSRLFHTRARADVIAALRSFFPRRGECEGGSHPRQAAAALLARVRELRGALTRSAVFSRHELIGTTLLLVADETCRAGAWMIDFGVTREAPAPLQHDVPWVPGNREDGYLLGLASLTEMLQELVAADEWD